MLTPSIIIDECPTPGSGFLTNSPLPGLTGRQIPKGWRGGGGTLGIDRANTILYLETIRVILYWSQTHNSFTRGTSKASYKPTSYNLHSFDCLYLVLQFSRQTLTETILSCSIVLDVCSRPCLCPKSKVRKFQENLVLVEASVGNKIVKKLSSICYIRKTKQWKPLHPTSR